MVGDGRNGRLDNFQRVYGVVGEGEERPPSAHRTGQGSARAAGALRDAVRTGSAMPIPLESCGNNTRDARRGQQSVVRKAG